MLHHVPEAAIYFLCRVYEFCTKRKAFVRAGPPLQKNLPSFARETASWKLKDAELDRIEDTIHRTIRRITVLEKHNDVLARERLGPDGRGVERLIQVARGISERTGTRTRTAQDTLGSEKTVEPGRGF